MKAFLERWLEPKADAPSQVEEIQREEVTESLGQETSIAGDEEAKPQAVQVLEDEIACRVEVFWQQIPERGPIPFLVAREAVEPQAGCCLSCGDPLGLGDPYRCAACSRAANVAVEMAMFISKTGTEKGGRVD